MKSLLTALLITMTYFAYAQSLENYRWKNRVILVFTDHMDNEKIIQQRKELLNDILGFNDRDLKLFILSEDEIYDASGQVINSMDAKKLRSRFEIPEGSGFTFVLIGKDGGAKLKTDEIVFRKRLYSIIDSMPMRQREMRQSGSN